VLRNGYPDVNLSFITNPEGFVSYLETLKEDQLPQVIISDLNMPKLNGYELLKEIKSSKRFSSIPFIIFSTSTNPLDKEKCIKAGAQEYIEKPFTLSQYHTIVDKVIKQHMR
jgi:CheY-like chemotaxis protein